MLILFIVQLFMILVKRLCLGDCARFPVERLALERSFAFTRLPSVLHVICFLVFLCVESESDVQIQ
jgi:hypothetical protein